MVRFIASRPSSIALLPRIYWLPCRSQVPSPSAPHNPAVSLMISPPCPLLLWRRMSFLILLVSIGIPPPPLLRWRWWSWNLCASPPLTCTDSPSNMRIGIWISNQVPVWRVMIKYQNLCRLLRILQAWTILSWTGYYDTWTDAILKKERRNEEEELNVIVREDKSLYCGGDFPSEAIEKTDDCVRRSCVVLCCCVEKETSVIILLIRSINIWHWCDRDEGDGGEKGNPSSQK